MSLSDVTGPFKMLTKKQPETHVVVKKNLPAPHIHIASTTGMPPGWSSRLHSHIEQASRNKAIPVSKSGSQKEALQLVGHVSAADITTGTVIAYVWDIQDDNGKRLHRVSGQKSLARKGPRGAWSAINDQTLQLIGDETARKIQGWMSAQGYLIQPVQLAQNQPQASNGAEPTPNRSETMATSEAQPKPIATPRLKSPVKETTKEKQASSKVATVDTRPLAAPTKETKLNNPQKNTIPVKNKPPKQVSEKPKPQKNNSTPPRKHTASTFFVFVGDVNGARGDGNAELTRAMISSLAKNGLGISPKPQPSGYKLEGKVKIEPTDNGKDQVLLSWAIKTSDGTLIGTVSQKNQVKSGSFNKSWGQTAFLAADAAAGSIKMVIDKREKQKI